MESLIELLIFVYASAILVGMVPDADPDRAPQPAPG